MKSRHNRMRPQSPETDKADWQRSSAEDALKTDQRSFDIGESGQFAPGGHYNQQRVHEPRTTLDDVMPPEKSSRRRK
jgi:hypothetical protein